MALAGLRVLVAEDEALVAMMIEDLLEDLGCEIAASAARLEDALEKAQTVTADVAVLDVNLAGRLSYPVIEVLRARGIPFVVATGYRLNDLPAELQGAPVLAKPLRRRSSVRCCSL
ncbi:MAG: response regulator [Rhodopila sp.]